MKKCVFALFLCVSLMIVGPACAELLTFDTLPPTPYNFGAAIPNGYGGLNWDNFAYLPGDLYFPPSGYQNGLVSPPNVAFNGYGNPADFWNPNGSPFTFVGAYFTGAWNDGLNIEVKGLFYGVTIYDYSFTVNTSGPVYFFADWSGINEVDFISSGGTPHGFPHGAGTQFAMDNLTVTGPVPEPCTLLLLGSGLVGLVGLRLRRN